MSNIFDIFAQLKKDKDPTGPIEYIIVGLGNPGPEYTLTRHNAGFMALDAIAEKFNTTIKRIKFKAITGEAVITGHRCLLLKPSTFMNNSGQSVVEAMQFYKVPIEKVVVIYDDISLEPSRIRIRKKGSDGGHNGIKSIIYLTGADTFPRIKLGVGKKPHPEYNLADWVLSNFNKDEQNQMKTAYDSCPDIVSLIVSGETDTAMNRYNG